MSILDRLLKAKLEVNALRNTASRALYALDKAIEESPCDDHTHEPTPVAEPIPPFEPEAPIIDENPLPPPVVEVPVEPTTAIHLTPPVPVTLTDEQLALWTKESTTKAGDAGNDSAAFRFFGNWTGELSYDDPLVYPGQENAAHLHIFSGLPGVNAHSTLQSMLEYEGETMWVGNQTFRPAVWHAAPIVDGQVKIHDHILLYYKQDARKEYLPGFPESYSDTYIREIRDARAKIIAERDGLDISLYSTKQAAQIELCREYHAEKGTIYGPENLPLGMCMIGGHYMDGTPGSATIRFYPNGTNVAGFEDMTLTKAVRKWWTSLGIAEGDIGPDSPVGAEMIEGVTFGGHWNGEIGSDNYRSHLRGPERNDRSAWLSMPYESHSRTAVSVTVFRKFSQREGEPALNRLRLSSDGPEMEAFATAHCDYVSVWPEQLRTWFYENIIKAHLSTSTSGPTFSFPIEPTANETGYRKARTVWNNKHSLSGYQGHPRFVPIPARPADAPEHMH